MTIVVCRVYGKRAEVINYEIESRNKLMEEGLVSEKSRWFFRRINWREFYNEDVYGKCMLDYCYSIM